ncbi:MAG TPA: aldo/keto reductase [Micromonosporaceae bacterium]|jgi:diketogulonate reductase-like aldo/keto reductase|nr:aldo/keto reductase [Micromonosporaceae bacterium]
MAGDTDTHTVALPGGTRMPLIGLGTWLLNGHRGYEAILTALELGYRHIDTATMYRNEAEVGRAISDSRVPREQIFITTKLPPHHAGRERDTILASLRALGTDYVDLWLIHWPPHGASPRTWREFIAVRNAGLARSIGVSNYTLSQLDELQDATGETPAVNQIRWSPSLYDPLVLAGHRERGVVLEGYSPFKNTDLADPRLVKIAAQHRVSPAQVVVRWHVQHGIVVIPKSARPERLSANIDVYGFSLSHQVIADIDALARP